MRFLLIADKMDDRMCLRCAIMGREPMSVIVEEQDLLRAMNRLGSGEKFDIVLLNPAMGESKGVDAVKLLNTISLATTKTPILVTGSKDIKSRAIAAGAHDYFCTDAKEHTASEVFWDMVDSALCREQVRPYSTTPEPAEVAQLKDLFGKMRERADHMERAHSTNLIRAELVDGVRK